MKKTYKIVVETDQNEIKADLSGQRTTTSIDNNTRRSQLIDVIDKSMMGRPKAWQPGTFKDISARLKIENYEHARIVGGMYGGITAYINWLIEQGINGKIQN